MLAIICVFQALSINCHYCDRAVLSIIMRKTSTRSIYKSLMLITISRTKFLSTRWSVPMTDSRQITPVG